MAVVAVVDWDQVERCCCRWGIEGEFLKTCLLNSWWSKVVRWTKTKTLLADRNETKKKSSPAGEDGNNLMGAVSGMKCVQLLLPALDHTEQPESQLAFYHFIVLLMDLFWTLVSRKDAICSH